MNRLPTTFADRGGSARVAVRALVAAIASAALAAGACSERVIFDTEDPWSETDQWPGLGDGKILVTNSGDDTLSFLDPVTLEPVYRAPTGRIPAEREGPHHGAATADGSHYFVGISNFVPGSGSGPHGSHGNGTVDGYLLKYETVTNRRVAEVRVDLSPGDVRLTPNGKYVLQSHFDLQSLLDAVENGEDPAQVQSRLAVIDAATMTKVAMIPVCPAAHGIAIADDSSEVYVACWGSDELAVVSLAEPITSESAVERFSVGPGGQAGAPVHGPYAVTVDPQAGEVWVSNLEGNSMVVFDPAMRSFDDARRIAMTGAPLFGAFAPDGSALYVPVQNPDSLVEIDPVTAAVQTLSFPAGQCDAPHGIILLADPSKAALVCEGDHVAPGTVARLDLSAPGVAVVEDEFEVGVYPDDLVVLPGAQDQ